MDRKTRIAAVLTAMDKVDRLKEMRDEAYAKVYAYPDSQQARLTRLADKADRRMWSQYKRIHVLADKV